MRSLRRLSPVALLCAAGCATAPTAPVAPVPHPIAAAAPAFAGYPGLTVPPRLPDGGYATPNRLVASGGALWHLRAGLNVAALTCRGPDAAAIVAGYNALLARHRAEFALSYRTLGQSYGANAGFDDAMTRLYNYYALPPAQDGLCAAATAVLSDAAVVPIGQLDGFAPAALARLDAPYLAVFTRQDDWVATRFADRAALVAVRGTIAPVLTVDPAIFAGR